MHPLTVASAALWGLAAGTAVPRAPWRAWIDEPPAGGEPAGHGPPASGSFPGAPAGWWWVALIGGLVCGVVARAVGPRPELVVWLLLVPVGLLLARIDLAVRRLPDVLTLPAALGTAALLGGAALLPGHAGSWPRALLGGVVMGAAYLGLLLINPAAMGWGDVKLAPTLGLVLGWYGWPVVLAGMMLGFVLAAATGFALIAARRADRRTALPFGPFMLVGALGALLLGTR